MRPKLFPVVEKRLEELLNSKFKIIIRKTSIIRKVLRVLTSNIFHYEKKCILFRPMAWRFTSWKRYRIFNYRKEKYIFIMDHFFKAVLWKVKLNVRMEFLFTLMDHIIEALWRNLKSKDREFFIIIMDFSITVLGKMIDLMALIAKKYTQMEALIEETLSMVLNMEKVNIHGQMEKYMLEILRMDIWKEKVL